MKYIKKYNESEEISSMGTLSNNDIEIISDLLLEFSEKWELPIIINEKGWGKYCSIQKFDKHFINLSIRCDKLEKSRKLELENDIDLLNKRIRKFGYNTSNIIHGHNFHKMIGYEYYIRISHTEEKSNKILKESINYDEYHTIPNEDIMDICLEMTDIDFTTDIRKYFINDDGSKTKEPLTEISYPIYDIELEINRESVEDITRWDGSYFYEDENVVKLFSSVLNKMKKILPVRNAFYYVANMRYNIRLILNPITLSENEVGFDFYQFSEKLKEFIFSMENELNDHNRKLFEIVDYWTGNGIRFYLFTDGIYKSDNYKQELWKKVDTFDNMDEYHEITDRIENFLDEYKDHIKYEHDLNQISPFKMEIKSGFLKKKLKTYERYQLEFTIKSK